MDKEVSNEFRIPLMIKEKDGIERYLEPVQTGIPFPKGDIYDLSQLIIRHENGDPIPSAATILSTWSDRSLKWVLFDFQITVPASGELTVFVENSQSTDQGISTPVLEVDDNDREFIIRTGEMVFQVGKDTFQPFKSVKIDGSKLIDKEKSKVTLTDKDGEEWRAIIDSSSLEFINRMRAVLFFKGYFSRTGRNHGLHFSARLSFYAGHCTARMDFTLWNPRAARHTGGLWDLGDPGSIFFKDLSFHIALSPNDSPEVLWKIHPNSPTNSTKPLAREIHDSDSLSREIPKDYLTGDEADFNGPTNLVIYQDSSGSENWNSRNHVNYLEQIPLSFQGYRIDQASQTIGEGLQATPIMTVKNGQHAVSGTLKYFWQNFPASMETNNGSLIISPFPGYFNDLFELQGGEQKTYSTYLNFSDKTSYAQSLSWIHYPLRVRATPEWYCNSHVFYYILSKEDIPKQYPYKECFQLAEPAVKGDETFFDRREIIDEYGWRNFGDLYADHEELLYEGEKPIISHYNNQYDLINSFLIQYVRSGEDDWFRLAEELVWHVIDIDIYHTDQDRHEYNHGLFWHTDHFCNAATSTHRGFSRKTLLEKRLKNYGGGPDYEHVYSQGLLNYYFLTGDLQAKAAVLELASFVTNGIDGPDQFKDLINKVVKNMVHYIKKELKPEILIPYRITEGPGRASGNGLGVLLDGFVLTGDHVYLSKAEYLIQQCIHPIDDIPRRRLDDVNIRLLYTVFLQALGKYLEIKIELQELDYMFFYAKESLIHYAKWMLDHEFPFLTKKELLDFPNFATRAATDIRKTNIFLLASRYVDHPLGGEFIKKADFFFNNSMKDLLALETRTLTRAIAIILQNMNIPLYFAKHPEEKSQVTDRTYDFGTPNSKTPLKNLLADNLKLLKRIFIKPKLSSLRSQPVLRSSTTAEGGLE